MDKFTSRHFAFLIMGASIVSMKTYPTIFTRNGMRDTWIAVSISTVIFIAYFLFILYTCRKFKCQNFYELYCEAVGKPLGTFFVVLFAAALFLTLIESASAEANSMHTNMLLETPTWMFLLFFAIPAIYTIGRDKVAIVTVTMIGIILICMAGINLAMLTAEYKRIELLFPIFENGLTSGFFIAILESLGLYATVAITLPYLADIKDNKRLLKHSLIGLLIVAQMEVVATSGVMMSFDIKYLNTMAYPKLLQTQLVQYLRFLESGELYVMLQILGGWYLKYVISFYALLRVLALLNFRSKFSINIITLVVIIISFFVSENLFVLFRFFNIYAYVSLFNFAIIPTIMTIIFYMKSSAKTKQSQEASVS
ncbi:MAG TPA: endospore germination permease [Patescibacteria group bacterium]|nr:endospore germination permease [Patescibacteria group bacterium]